MTSASEPAATTLRALFWLFFRLGATSFGGPAAHVAVMEHEIVSLRGWLSREAFLDLLSAANLVPGPNSTELALHIGRERRGLAGMCVAGAAFTAPAVAITLAMAHVYVTFGERPELHALLAGVKPVMLAIVLQALARLAPVATASVLTKVAFALAVLLGMFGLHELLVLALAALLVFLVRRPQPSPPAMLCLLAGPITPLAASLEAVTLPSLFWVFFKTGATLFGSGYVLLAYLRADLVERLGWLSDAQLLDAIAIGQVTPGPVFTTATFVGYLLAGNVGAFVATLGIFLPAFVFVALSGPLVPKLRASVTWSALLDGVNAGSLALMVLVCAELARHTVVDVKALVLLLVSLVLLLRFRLNATWLVLGGGLVGYLVPS